MNQDSYKPAFTYECQLDAKDIKVDAIRGLASQELYFFLEWWFKNQNCSKILRKSLKTRRITSHFGSWVFFFSRTFLLGKKRESNRAKNQKKWGRKKTSRPTSDRCLDGWAVEFRWNCRQGQQHWAKGNEAGPGRSSGLGLLSYSLWWKFAPESAVRKKESQNKASPSFCCLLKYRWKICAWVRLWKCHIVTPAPGREPHTYHSSTNICLQNKIILNNLVSDKFQLTPSNYILRAFWQVNSKS